MSRSKERYRKLSHSLMTMRWMLPDFIFGADASEIVWHEGWMRIDEEMDPEPAEKDSGGSNHTAEVSCRDRGIRRFSPFCGKGVKEVR